MYSQKDAASVADPFQVSASVPYTYKGMAFGKGYKFALKPAFETVFMDLDGDSSRENILNSMILSADNTFVMHKNYVASYSLEVRSDDSLSASSTGPANADAMKYTLKTAQTFLLEGSKEIIVANAGVIVNDSKGDNPYYRRYEIGVNYMRPAAWETTMVLGLSYYVLDFSKMTSDARTDNNTTLTLTGIKPIKDWVSWMMTGSYSSNPSTDPTYNYSKYTITTAAIFNCAL